MEGPLYEIVRGFTTGLAAVTLWILLVEIWRTLLKRKADGDR